ncbi:serine O-acetyltransferase [Paucilactobacillus hokkaidonensis]|uniref:Serine acetyltransferase n=1 Tax=Paucilactobacillus hokkaidonensis TaxID=1193095 RepID=A0ABR5Q4U2_9LACO|nr:serine O-acetyltransferase [Paucilactobacillus hokkaidonensis]
MKIDPAAKSMWEVIFTYSGFQALAFYRVSHRLYQAKRYFWAALVAHLGKKMTQVEIHPGAKIGNHVFIDHGTGVVIGETAIVGNYVTILHGVTLGSRYNNDGPRHPRISDHVLVGANALLLGPITVGSYAKVGAGSVVLHDVPKNATIVGNPGRVVNREIKLVVRG